MGKIPKRSKSYEKDYLLPRLKDGKAAQAYLAGALEDEEYPEVLLRAMGQVIKAKGIRPAHLAKKTNLNRQNLYRILSGKSRPRIDVVMAILSAMGFRLDFALKKTS